MLKIKLLLITFIVLPLLGCEKKNASLPDYSQGTYIGNIYGNARGATVNKGGMRYCPDVPERWYSTSYEVTEDPDLSLKIFLQTEFRELDANRDCLLSMLDVIPFKSQLLNRYDTNKDKRFSSSEWKKIYTPHYFGAAFGKFDNDGSGYLDDSEVSTWLVAYYAFAIRPDTATAGQVYETARNNSNSLMTWKISARDYIERRSVKLAHAAKKVHEHRKQRAD